jgi:hypothetical protein
MRCFLVVSLALLALGCVDNDRVLTISRFVAADPNTQCVISTSSVLNQTGGILDVGLVTVGGTFGYLAFPVATNNLPEVTPTGGIELNAINVTGVNVELVVPDLLATAIPVAERKFSIPSAAGRLGPNGQAVFSVELIPHAIAVKIFAVINNMNFSAFPTVVAKVSPLGDRAGDTIVGAPVPFPVQMCSFCLSGGGTIPAGCPATGFKPMSVVNGGCFEQQDASSTCCGVTNANGSQALLCGKQVPMATN